MKLQFLCANHHKQLSTHPKQAMYCWQQAYETGKSLSEDYQWRDAIPHLGCAYETAEILLGKAVIDPISAANIFKASTVLLGKALLRIGQVEPSLNIYHLAIRRLEQQFSLSFEHRKEINHHLQHLNECLDGISSNKHSGYRGFADRCQQALILH